MLCTQAADWCICHWAGLAIGGSRIYCMYSLWHLAAGLPSTQIDEVKTSRCVASYFLECSCWLFNSINALCCSEQQHRAVQFLTIWLNAVCYPKSSADDYFKAVARAETGAKISGFQQAGKMSDRPYPGIGRSDHPVMLARPSFGSLINSLTV